MLRRPITIEKNELLVIVVFFDYKAISKNTNLGKCHSLKKFELYITSIIIDIFYNDYTKESPIRL
jgi:hypothetical protein